MHEPKVIVLQIKSNGITCLNATVFFFLFRLSLKKSMIVRFLCLARDFKLLKALVLTKASLDWDTCANLRNLMHDFFTTKSAWDTSYALLKNTAFTLNTQSNW